MTPNRPLPAVEPALADRDAAMLRDWLAHPASAYWMMPDLTEEQARDYLAGIAADPCQQAWILRLDGEPIGYAETYDPAHRVLAEAHDAEPGDFGMHLLVAPAPADPAARRHGLTRDAMAAVLEHCFGPLGARRVVVEPDRRNAAVLAKNAEAGFRPRRLVDLPDKTALLSTLDPEDFARARAGRAAPQGEAVAALDHLRPEPMEEARRRLAAKALAEFSHEHLLEPRPVDGDRWEVRTPAGEAWSFAARVLPLHHWDVDPASIRREGPDGSSLPVDPQRLVLGFHEALGIPDALLGTYLEEVASTLAGLAFKAVRGGPTAEQLARGRTDVDAAADFQQTEAAMTEGHPAFVAANGRIGFDVEDFRRYAPEAGDRFRYVWIAARKDAARLDLSADRTEEEHWAQELDPAARARFAEILREHGGSPEDYVLLPVHPWQFRHRVAVAFAPDLADGRLVLLGEAPDEYQPQQSIRTAFCRTRPERSYVKTALSIQNMGFLRGMSPEYMEATPAINDWVAEQVRTDPVLRGAGFDVLREHASAGYTGDAYHGSAARSDQKKMIAALWRESPLPRLREGERLLTMAALLHRDAHGRSVAAEFVRASGAGPEQWLAEYLGAYLVPVLHCLEVHDLAFMPHGENLVLRVRDGRVVGAFMKDIGEEAAVLGDRPLPAGVERMRHPIDDAETAQLVLTDVVDGVLRHLAAHLDRDGVLPVGTFWATVRRVVVDYGRRDLPRRRRLDLLRPEFEHSCLNRLQLRNTLEMVDLQDASGSLIYSGTLRNPLVEHPGAD